MNKELTPLQKVIQSIRMVEEENGAEISRKEEMLLYRQHQKQHHEHLSENSTAFTGEGESIYRATDRD